MRFKDKIAIVTGAGSGIGRATSLQLASEGATVLIADLNEAHGNETVALIQAKKGQAQFVKTDVSRPADIENVIRVAASQYDRVDIVVNNAAIMTFSPVTEISIEDWDRVLATNLRSAFLFTKLAVPLMKGGAIVNVSSVHAHETTANNSPYAASKGGLEAFTRAISREYPASKVRINAIAPGAVSTPMLWNNPNVKSGREKVEGAVGQPEDIANAICFLASEEAKFIQGATLIVDGGRLDIL